MTRKKTGGRKQGTPNKATASMKKAISELVSEYWETGMMRSDLLAIKKPSERLALVERLIQYTTPKMQAVAFTEADEQTKTIEDRLIELSQPKK